MLILLAPGIALADGDAPSRSGTSAREHYARGAALYDATRYEAALREFEEAQSEEPRTELVFDIARCLDRLGRREEARAAYEKYLASSPDASNADEVRGRLVALTEIKVAKPVLPLTPVTPAALPSTKRHRYLGPGLLGGSALIVGAVGAGLLGSALTSYNSLSSACAPNCSSNAWVNLPAREHAGEALLGIAAVAVVADVVWFVVASRRK